MNRGANFFLNLQDKISNDINSMMIGIVKSYNVSNNMAEMIPLHTDNGTGKEFPPIISVPIGFFSIGGYSIKVQPKVGDRFILLFSDYDIENLLINGTKTNKTQRTHALEDCIALPLSINFLNEANNATQDLTISKSGTGAYIKMSDDGGITLNGSYIKLGENAAFKVTKEIIGKDGIPVIVQCDKVYGE